ALEKNSSARYASAIEMTRALSPFGKIPTSISQPVASVAEDTKRDPVETTAPMMEQPKATRAPPPPAPAVALAPAPAKPHSSPWGCLGVVAACLGALVLVGGGVGFAYSRGYIGPPQHPTRAIERTTPAATVTPLPSTGEIATLTPTTTDSAPPDT